MKNIVGMEKQDTAFPLSHFCFLISAFRFLISANVVISNVKENGLYSWYRSLLAKT